MLLELLLGLRNGRERVSVILRPGRPRPELGTVLPQEDDRRSSLPQRWGWQREAPRKEAPVGIEEALPVRTQTILSHGVPADVRAAINGEVTDAIAASRKDAGRVDVKIRIDS